MSNGPNGLRSMMLAGSSRMATFTLMVTVISSTSGACASLRHPRPQTVSVHSRPSGADVFVDDRYVGVTPVQISPNRQDRKIVLRLEKDGFESEQLPIRRSLSRLLFGNLVLPALVSVGAAQEARGAEIAQVFAGTSALTFGIDFSTGAAFRFPPSVRATLSRFPAVRDRGRTAPAEEIRRAKVLADDNARNVRKGNRLLPAWLLEKGAGNWVPAAGP